MVAKHNPLNNEYEEDEAYCREYLGIKNARGPLARRLREMYPPAGEEGLLNSAVHAGRFVVVDLETTGMKADEAGIIEIGAVEVDGFQIGKELSSLVNPGVPVPYFISRLTGIHNRMLRAAPPLEQVLPSLEGMLRGRILVAHNLKFDRAFLKKAWRQVWDMPLNGPGLCTLGLSRRVFPDLPSHKLDALAAHLDIRAESKGNKGRHRALGDAKITAKALVKILQKLESEGVGTVEELLTLQSSKRKKKPSLPTPHEHAEYE